MLEKIQKLLIQAIPDANVEMRDYKHDGRHVVLTVTSTKFEGLGLVDQHRLVMAPLKPMLESGEVHALKIKTHVP